LIKSGRLFLYIRDLNRGVIYSLGNPVFENYINDTFHRPSEVSYRDKIAFSVSLYSKESIKAVQKKKATKMA
jgi:hypothetical protein